MPVCRNCFIPSDVTSITAYSQPAPTAYLKNFCSLNLPCIVILSVFFRSCPFTRNLNEETDAVFSPASSKIAVIRCTTVDLPLVPVTPTTFNFRDGKLYSRAANQAKHL